MNLTQLRHVIFELGERFDVRVVYIVGSSAVLASIPAPEQDELVATRDVDVALPAGAPISIDRIDFVVGEGSDFDQQHGYYAQGVSLTTPTYAPTGWVQRTVAIRVGKVTANCMELHDLALAKYGAGREKDLAFSRALAGTGALSRDVLIERLAAVQTIASHRDLIEARIEADFAI